MRGGLTQALGLMTYYHGTSDGQIVQFKLGVRGKGEQLEPVNCIWVSSTFAGAEYHAVQVVGPKRKTNPNYVYEVLLPQSHVMADSRDPQALSPVIAEKIIKYCMGWRRFICRPKTWLDALACYIDSISPKGDRERKNGIFRVLRTASVDALVAPNFTWHRTRYQRRYTFHVFDATSGDAVALLNLNGIQIGQKTPVSR